MDTRFTQVWALLMEVKPYVLLLIVFIWGIVQSTYVYHEIGEAKP